MTIKFYVNGMIVDTYKCKSKSVPLSDEDEQEIEKIKRAAYRNYGYPAITEVDTTN